MNPRWIPFFYVVALAAAGGCRNSKDLQQLPPANGPGAPPAVSIPELSADNPVAAVSGNNSLVVTGTSRPIREAKVGPKGSGVIVSLPVEEGDGVKKGQLLFRLESANQALAVSQAEAALSGALVAESTARTELGRVKALRERGSVAPAALDQVQAQFEGAQAAVKQARAALARARQATADTSVRAPIDGVVARRLHSVGDTVTMMPPTVVLIIQDISTLEVRGNVPETMLKQLRPGSELRVRFPAVEVEREVTIERINPSVDPMTRTVEVVAMVPNRDSALKAGMLVELDFSPLEADKPAEDTTKEAATPGKGAAPAGA
jgi:RND family efflux transporter MFP subunit